MKIIIIDDEQLCTDLLANYVTKYFSQHQIVAICNTAQDGLNKIKELQPDLILLDVEMPKMNGFQLLDAVGTGFNFHVIFTTAYDKYAIKAFKYSAIDYLLKPIDRSEFIDAIEKIANNKAYYNATQHALLNNVASGNETGDTIALANSDGITFANISNIVRCESSGNYTTFYINENEKVLTTKLIKDVEELLANHKFMRVHQSHLVNLQCIKKYNRNDGGELLMSNGDIVPIS